MVSRNAPIHKSAIISTKITTLRLYAKLPNYVELTSKYDPERGYIDHTAPHRLDQNHSIPYQPYHLVKRGFQTSCNRKHE
jgi:hypothetical protein